MSSEFINDAKYRFSTTLATAVAITTTTNTSPAIVTPHPTEGDALILNLDNWSVIDAGFLAGPAGAIAGLDTSDTSDFLPGEGTGSYRVASNFVALTQIRDIAQSGGDTNQFTYAYIDDKSKRQRSKPTDKNPLVLTFTMDYDATKPWFAALEELDKKQQLVVMMETLPTGDTLMYTGFMSFNSSPTRSRNENMEVVATMSINSDIVRYPAGFTGS